MTTPLLVTGASGKLGRRVLELLLERKAGPIIATTRKPESLADFAARGVDVRHADFDDPASLAKAFVGAKRALLVSTDELIRPGHRLAQQEAAVRAFVDARVEHVVYTSLPNAPASSISFAPDHAGTEAALARTQLGFTILRNNIYADMLLFSLPGALASGKLVDARGDGKLAWVTREDCARIATAALVDSPSGRQTYDVTGPEALASADLAAIASEVFGRNVEHVNVPIEALVQGMVEHGLPRPLAEVYASIDRSVARGELATVTDVLPRVTGRPAQSMRAFLLAYRSAFEAAASASS